MSADDRRNPPTAEASTKAGTGARLVAEERIPIVEERVRIEKREHAGRTISVSTRPTTETVKVSEPVRRETVSVDRVPVDRVVDEIPAIREEDGVTIIPVVEERVRVVVETVLAEEIHLKRKVSEETVEKEVELRRTGIDIDE